jgi:hypothetical protein
MFKNFLHLEWVCARPTYGAMIPAGTTVYSLYKYYSPCIIATHQRNCLLSLDNITATTLWCINFTHSLGLV